MMPGDFLPVRRCITGRDFAKGMVFRALKGMSEFPFARHHSRAAQRVPLPRSASLSRAGALRPGNSFSAPAGSRPVFDTAPRGRAVGAVEAASPVLSRVTSSSLSCPALRGRAHFSEGV